MTQNISPDQTFHRPLRARNRGDTSVVFVVGIMQACMHASTRVAGAVATSAPKVVGRENAF